MVSPSGLSAGRSGRLVQPAGRQTRPFAFVTVMVTEEARPGLSEIFLAEAGVRRSGGGETDAYK